MHAPGPHHHSARPPAAYSGYQGASGFFQRRTLAELLAGSPSRAHGLSAEKEAQMKRTAINLIISAGSKLQMDHLAIATAVVYLHRFYALKSLMVNDNFVIGTACLYLAGKVEDTPKSVRDVLYACFEWRFRGQADVLRRLYDKEFYEACKERVFTAERALMYALGFDFNVAHPYEPFFTIMGTDPVRQLREELARTDPRKAQGIGQNALILINDTLKTPLCLQYDPWQVAGGVVWAVLRLYRQDPDMLDAQGRVWWTVYGLTPDSLQDIHDQLLPLYYVQQPPGEEQLQSFGSMMQLCEGIKEGKVWLVDAQPAPPDQHRRQQHSGAAAPQAGPAPEGARAATPGPPRPWPAQQQPPVPTAPAAPAAAAAAAGTTTAAGTAAGAAAPPAGGVKSEASADTAAGDAIDEYEELFAS